MVGHPFLVIALTIKEDVLPFYYLNLFTQNIVRHRSLAQEQALLAQQDVSLAPEQALNMPLSSRQSQNRTTFFPNSPPLTLFVSMVILFQRMGKTKPSKAPSA